MRLLILLIFFCFLTSPVLAQTPPAPDASARCSVCGMFVAPHTNWVAVLETDAGERFYFDGPKDMFAFYNDLARYLPKVTPDQVKLFVTEYYTVQLTSAEEVFFVVGSDVLGPMGQELVPVADRKAAETFIVDHAGTGLLRFDGRKLVKLPEQT